MKSAQQVVQESERREETLKQAIAELEEFEARYAKLVELSPVFAALKTVIRKRPTSEKRLTVLALKK